MAASYPAIAPHIIYKNIEDESLSCSFAQMVPLLQSVLKDMIYSTGIVPPYMVHADEISDADSSATLNRQRLVPYGMVKRPPSTAPC